MNLDVVKVGELQCNCYLLDIDDNVLVIDPGDEFKKIKDKIGNRNVVGVIITHYHFDHIGALDEMINEYKVNIYDRNNMNEGDNSIGKFKFEIIYTPGHKDDAITVYFKNSKCMFCGDFIFRDSIGRCDLPGGSIQKMIESINKIKTYDKDTIIYSGHGDSTTLEYEINNNIYFQDVNYI